MNRSRLVAALWIIGSSLFAACGGDDASDDTQGPNSDAGSSSDAAPSDATTRDGSDVSDATVSRGDASDAASSNDAADAGDDAKVDHDAGPPGLVTVRVTAFNGTGYVPLSAAVVVFYDPDGTPHAPIGSGASGIVTASVFPGSSVTISMPYHDSNEPELPRTQRLITYLGIEPGDDLPATTLYGFSRPTGTTYSVQFLAPTGDIGFDRAAVGDGCVALDDADFPNFPEYRYGGVWDSCIFGGQVGALAMAFQNATTIDSFAEATTPFLPDAGTVFADWNWQPATPVTLNVQGALSPAAEALRLGLGFRRGTTSYMDTDSLEDEALSYDVNIIDGGLEQPISTGFPSSGLIDNVAYTANLLFVGGGSVSVVASNPLDEGMSLDTSELLPHLHDAATSYDEGSNVATLTFASDGSLASAAGEELNVSWSDCAWTIVSPPSTTVIAPPLTSELVRGHFPINDGGAMSVPQVRAFGSTTLPSYAAFRPVHASFSSASNIDYMSYGPIPHSPVRMRFSRL